MSIRKKTIAGVALALLASASVAVTSHRVARPAPDGSGRRRRLPLPSLASAFRLGALTGEERLRQIVDHLGEVVWLCAPDLSECYYINPAYERVWGRSRESYYREPKSPLEAVVPEDRRLVLDALEELYSDGSSVEFRIVRPDGEVRWISARTYPIRDLDGRIHRIVGIAEDITERKAADLGLQRLLRREREARREIGALLESISEAFFAVDHSWCITYLNRETERIFGRRGEELVSRDLWEVCPAFRGTEVETALRRAMKERVPVECEYHLEATRTWLDLRAYPSSRGLSVFLRDVTRRKRTEEGLRQSEANLRALADSIPQLTWMAAADGWIYWYNQRWYDFTGAAFDDLVGWGWQDFVHPEKREEVVEKIRSAIAAQNEWEETIPIRRRDGEYRWFLSRAVPVRDRSGSVVRWFGTDTDITERFEAEAERSRILESERRAREEADRRRDEMERQAQIRARLTRGFSHDVKNPLGAADGFLQLLEEEVHGTLEPRQRESVARARSSIRTALDLIDEMTTIAYAEAGEIDVHPVATDLDPLIRAAAETYQAQAEAKDLDLAVDLPETLPTIRTDPLRLRQVLGNLLSNAVKFTDRGGITVTASPSEAGPEGDGGTSASGRCWVAISVVDTGIGIPAEKEHLLFEEFARLAEEQGSEGAGIGLSISQKIAQALGGTITVESEVGRGSTFTLWVPGEAEPAPERSAES